MGIKDAFKRLTGENDEDEEEREYDTDDSSDDFGYDDGIRSSNISTLSKTGKVLNIPATTRLQVIVVKVENMRDASEIADHYKSRKAVVLNFDNTNKDVANRMLDFLGGVAYISEGELKRISNTSYILVPYNVDISGDLLEELERNNGDSLA